PMEALAGPDLNGDTTSFPDRAFSAPGVSFQRNAFRDRRVYDVDLRLAKKFRLPRERMLLSFTADFFNIFNFANIVYVSGTPSPFNSLDTYGPGISSSTGAVLSANSGFQLPTGPQFCSAANSGCYNPAPTSTPAPLGPPPIQLGVRFDF